MRRAFAVLGFTLVLASAAASFTGLPITGVPKAAATPAEATFLLPASDGYGVADCLAAGGECGTVVAEAWCEAQGYARATSFGLAAPEDVTGSVETAALTSRSERPIAITCAK